jgi:hypothetical protein
VANSEERSALLDLAGGQRYRGLMRTPFVVVGLALGAVVIGCAGCGGSSSGSNASLNCAYLASDNCWKTTAAASSSCLPPSSETGVLSADGSTCTYASGDVVTFTPPLVLPLSSTPNWNFTVKTSSGASCLTYQDDGNGAITLTVDGQTVKETTPGGLAIALTCPDGKTYSNPNAFNLLSCPDAGLLDGLPGVGWSSSDTSVSLSLIATSTTSSEGQAVFDCRTATTP